MRVAINLLTEDPETPSGAHWFWTRVIPEMAKRLESDEELHLLVSPKSRHLHQGYGPNVFYITYPWSNERRTLRTLTEHLYSPRTVAAQPHRRLQHPDGAAGEHLLVDCVIHMKTMHAFTAPDSISTVARALPPAGLSALRAGRRCDHHQLREPALGDRELPERRPAQAQADLRGGRPRPLQAGRRRARPGRRSPRTASRSRSCCSCRRCGRIRTVTGCCGRGRSLAMSSRIGSWRSSALGATRSMSVSCTRSPPSSASQPMWSLSAAFRSRRPCRFYQAADVFVVSVAQRDLRPADPRGHGVRLPGRDLGYQRHAGNRRRSRAVLSDPKDPASIAQAIVDAVGPGRIASVTMDYGEPVSSRGERQLPRPSTCTARSPSVDAIDGHEDPCHRWCGVHRITYLRPAPGARARRRRARRADPAGTPEWAARVPQSRASTSTRATPATATSSLISCAASTPSTTSPPTRTTCPTSRDSPT